MLKTYKSFILFGISLLFACSAYAEAEYKIVWQNVWPPGHRNYENAVRFGNAVMAETNGRIKIEYHNGEPVPTKELLNACGVGLVDAFNSGTPYYSGKVGIGDFLMMPNTFASWEDYYDAFMETDIWEIMDSVYRKASNTTVIFPFVIFSDERFIMSKKSKVTKLDDLKGLKIRATGGALNEVVKLVGAVPVQAITGELYTSLQRGLVDGTLVPIYALKEYNLAEVTHQVLMPPIFRAMGTPVWMNLDTWNKLPKDLQDTIRRVARDRSLYQANLKEIQTRDNELEREAREKYGMEFTMLPEEDIQKTKTMFDPVWDWYVGNCEKQGFGEEARKIRKILSERYEMKIGQMKSNN